jgi:cyanate lyase
MEKSEVGKADLEKVFLNDIGQCMKDMFSGKKDIDESWHELNLAVTSAEDLGITPEYILSTLINSVPECVKQDIVEKLAESLNLTEGDIEEMQAPVD